MAKTVLIVDDSRVLRQMTATTMRHAGFEVLEAADGANAVTLAKTERADLVITDQNMPGMDGMQVVQALRSIDGYAGIPILILTTESSAELKQRGRSAGATGWLVKPFDPTQLVALANRLTGAH